ncbi:MAG: hypothetical protein ACD_19C00182G0040 [uncultured bacterium]|nr:MAG: hypothetical protein ACD_19C00182G0040 [uncultured bacterium]
MEEVNVIPPATKNNSFLVTLLSVLLLISILIAGFFAYQTQKLVAELRVKNEELRIKTPTSIPIFKPLTINNLNDGDIITSPLEIIGNIDRNWTWEATFSIEIIDSNEKSLNTVPVSVIFNDEQSQTGSFSVLIPFTTKTDNGFVVIHADNPSGLPQNDKSIKIPVKFAKDQLFACTMEAKICPDGSAVGRSGSKCEFAPCPTPKP